MTSPAFAETRESSAPPGLETGAYPELTSAERLIAAVVECGEAWADADASASSLEETKRTLLAKLTVEHVRGEAPVEPGTEDEPAEQAEPAPRGKRRGVSKAEAELRATADPRYVDHIERMVRARQHSNRMRVRYDLGKMQIELMRTIHATRRQEMRFTGMAN